MGTVGLKARVQAKLALTIKVKRTGRVRPADLDQSWLTRIGNYMVTKQKERWAQAINAEGNPARPLSVKYLFEKRAYTGNTKPKRDMKMTGETIANFQLRKANNGTIRAENTTRLARKKADRAQGYEQMIGFAGSDQMAIFNATQKVYGEKLKTAWVPLTK